MIPEQKKVMLRYTTLVLFFALMSVCIIVKAGLIMFAERQYWKDVADRFVKEMWPSRLPGETSSLPMAN